MEGTELLSAAIKKGDLHYFRHTGDTAYVAKYADGEMRIVTNHYAAREARPGIDFTLVASASWKEGQGYPAWTIYDDLDEPVDVIFDEED